MKPIYSLLFCFLTLCPPLFSAPIRFQPTPVTQIDGSVIHCFSSGDEFFNYLHDAEEYTLIFGDDGFLYYAVLNKAGFLEPSTLRVNQGNPKRRSILPRTLPSPEWYQSRRQFFETAAPKSNSKLTSSGDLYGLVVFIRFADDTDFEENDYQSIKDLFNSESPKSMKHFYKLASYGKLNIDNYFFPNSTNTAELSYQDSKDRSYYQAYNASLNPNGYRTDNERSSREWTLLRSAITAIVAQGNIPSNNTLDNDGDGYADFVSFIIKGQSQGWSDLLWAHKWQFPYSLEPQLSVGLRIGTFTFMPQSQTEQNVICHEAFHAFGAPDLYHYYVRTDLNPCGPWDLMDGGDGQMSAIMKYLYTDWKSGQEIHRSGRYVLYPQAETDINSMLFYQANKDERIVLEYRKNNSNIYEEGIPGNGLLVFRENRLYDGNASYDGKRNFDGIYIFRPNGSLSSNGSLNKANLNTKNYFGLKKGKHYAYTVKGEEIPIEISNIINHDDSISFDFIILNQETVHDVSLFEISRNKNQYLLRWEDSIPNNSYVVCTYDQAINDTLAHKKVYSIGNRLPNGAQIIYIGTNSHFDYRPSDSIDARYFKIFCTQYENYSKGTQAVNFSQHLYSNLDKRLDSDLSQENYTLPSPNWGALIGHNSKLHTEFLEYYSVPPGDSFALDAIELNIANVIAKNGALSTIKLMVHNVNSQNKKPDQCLLEYSVNMTNLKKGRNIIRLPQRLQLNTPFFVGIKIDYLDICDTIAILSTASNTSRTPSLVVATENGYQYLSELQSKNISALMFPLNSKEPYISCLPKDTLILSIAKATPIQVISHDGASFEYSSDQTWLSIEKDPTFARLYLTAKDGTPKGSRAFLRLRHKDGYTHQTVVVYPDNTSINTSIVSTPLRVYPNPVKTVIYVDGLFQRSLLKLIDIHGRILKSVHVQGEQIEIPCEDLPQGVYILKETLSGRSASVIKQ